MHHLGSEGSWRARQVNFLIANRERLIGAFAMLTGASFPGLGYLLSPLVAALLWVPATYVLLLPQFQPVERDANRPI